MDIDTILKTLVAIAIILLPVAQLVRDWQYNDKRTKKHHSITRYIVISWLVVGLMSVVIIYHDGRKIEQLINQEKVLAKDSALRMHEFLRIYMMDYYQHIDALLNSNIFSDDPKIPVKTNFPFKRIKNIIGISTFYSDEIGKKYYISFFESQNNLLEQVGRCVLQVDLKHYPELSKILLSFIKETEFDNPNENFNLAFKVPKSKDFNLKKFIVKMIDDSANIEYPADIEPYNNNVLRPYVRLYNMVNNHIKFYEDYTAFIKNLVDEEKSNHGIE